MFMLIFIAFLLFFLNDITVAMCLTILIVVSLKICRFSRSFNVDRVFMASTLWGILGDFFMLMLVVMITLLLLLLSLGFSLFLAFGAGVNGLQARYGKEERAQQSKFHTC